MEEWLLWLTFQRQSRVAMNWATRTPQSWLTCSYATWRSSWRSSRSRRETIVHLRWPRGSMRWVTFWAWLMRLSMLWSNSQKSVSGFILCFQYVLYFYFWKFQLFRNVLRPSESLTKWRLPLDFKIELTKSMIALGEKDAINQMKGDSNID